MWQCLDSINQKCSLHTSFIGVAVLGFHQSKILGTADRTLFSNHPRRFKYDNAVEIYILIWCFSDNITNEKMNYVHYINKYSSLAFWLGRLTFVSDRVSKLMADSRPKGPQLQLGHPRVDELLFSPTLHSLYSTRPHGLVQAIFWHTCPDLDLGPWYCLTHWTHIALSGSMTSRVRVSARFRPSPPLYPHFNRPSGFWPCIKSCMVGGSDKYLYQQILLRR